MTPIHIQTMLVADTWFVQINNISINTANILISRLFTIYILNPSSAVQNMRILNFASRNNR